MAKSIDEQIQDVQDVIQKTTNATTKKYAEERLKVLEASKSAGAEGVIHETLQQLQTLLNQGVGQGTVDEKQVKDIVDKELAEVKVGISNLDPSLLAMLGQTQKVNVNLTLPPGITVSGQAQQILDIIMEPENQIVLSDLLALNNVYMYGAAGTGKSFRAGQIKKIMSSKGNNWDLIEVNCNQFTSPLDLIGGQTIEGYQKGKLEMAWTNVDADGKKYDGAILLLDELPKLDPNTAGLLNAALAKLSERELDDTTGKQIKPTIMNGRGQKIKLGNMFVYATGNAPLNEADPDYEANFKQDLSLQDRFVGSMYKVFANYRRDRELLNGNANDDGYLFIFNHMMLCREAILNGEDGVSFANKGFVSLRILLSMKRTFIEYARSKRDTRSIIQYCPKSVILSLNSFLEIFTPRQRDVIKTAMRYDDFVSTAKDRQDRKYKFNERNEPIMSDTDAEKTLSDSLVNDYEARTESIIQCKF